MTDDLGPISPVVTFGDWEPEDSYSPPGDDLSPLAVARRLHEERNFIAALAGDEVVKWGDLSDEERDVAVELMVKIVAWLRLEGVIGTPREPREPKEREGFLSRARDKLFGGELND